MDTCGQQRDASDRNRAHQPAFLVALDRLTAPLYRPIRRLLPDFGGIDFSPLVILILIQVIKKLLAGVVIQYYGVG
jgi:YggT family protein